MKKILYSVAGIFIFGLIAIQFVPVDRDNPPVTADLVVPPAVRKILKRSCFDCHSNETNWPWYSFVAPVSWLVADDVSEGREHLNFSEWGNLSDKKHQNQLREVWKEIVENEMPIDKYLYLHPDAKLSEDEKVVIAEWIVDSGATLEINDLDDDDDHDH